MEGDDDLYDFEDIFDKVSVVQTQEEFDAAFEKSEAEFFAGIPMSGKATPTCVEKAYAGDVNLAPDFATWIVTLLQINGFPEAVIQALANELKGKRIVIGDEMAKIFALLVTKQGVNSNPCCSMNVLRRALDPVQVPTLHLPAFNQLFAGATATQLAEELVDDERRVVIKDTSGSMQLSSVGQICVGGGSVAKVKPHPSFKEADDLGNVPVEGNMLSPLSFLACLLRDMTADVPESLKNLTSHLVGKFPGYNDGAKTVHQQVERAVHGLAGFKVNKAYHEMCRAAAADLHQWTKGKAYGHAHQQLTKFAWKDVNLKYHSAAVDSELKASTIPVLARYIAWARFAHLFTDLSGGNTSVLVVAGQTLCASTIRGPNWGVFSGDMLAKKSNFCYGGDKESSSVSAVIMLEFKQQVVTQDAKLKRSEAGSKAKRDDDPYLVEVKRVVKCFQENTLNLVLILPLLLEKAVTCGPVLLVEGIMVAVLPNTRLDDNHIGIVLMKCENSKGGDFGAYKNSVMQIQKRSIDSLMRRVVLEYSCKVARPSFVAFPFGAFPPNEQVRLMLEEACRHEESKLVFMSPVKGGSNFEQIEQEHDGYAEGDFPTLGKSREAANERLQSVEMPFKKKFDERKVSTLKPNSVGGAADVVLPGLGRGNGRGAGRGSADAKAYLAKQKEKEKQGVNLKSEKD